MKRSIIYEKSIQKIAVLLVMFMLAAETTAGVQAVNVSAASTKPANNKAKKAYKNYVGKYLSSAINYPDSRYKLYDINGDGISEMFFQYRAGVRAGYKIYTYRKGEIIKLGDMEGCGGIYRNKKKKQIYVSFSNGASDSWLTCYKMKNKKLVQVRKYRNFSDFQGQLLM